MSATVLLADDHQIVRQGLRALLEMEPDVTVIGEASDGLAAVEMAERQHPDILLVDLMMPGLPGIEVVRQVKQRAPETRSIVFSMYSSDAYIHEAFRNGAAGYLLKGDDSSRLGEAIRSVLSGKRYLCPAVSERVIDAYFDHAGEFGTRDPYDELTAREREVVQLMAEGAAGTDIAERLCISPRTVEIHRANALRKLNLRTQSDVVRYAVRRGLVPLE